MLEDKLCGLTYDALCSLRVFDTGHLDEKPVFAENLDDRLTESGSRHSPLDRALQSIHLRAVAGRLKGLFRHWIESLVDEMTASLQLKSKTQAQDRVAPSLEVADLYLLYSQCCHGD